MFPGSAVARSACCLAPEGLLWSAYSVCAWVLCGAFSACCCGLFRARLGRPGGVARILCAASGFPVCYEVDNSPLFNFNRMLSPFLGARGNLCAETSYLRVQCLCGRADVWSARAVGATILDVFGYGLPTESGVGSQWRYCYCRGREVGNHSEKDIGSLGKFAFIPSSHLKI